MTENNLKFSGVDTVALAKKYGTPLYVMSEDIIREKIGYIKKGFLYKYQETKAFYASKAFLSLRMCKIIKEEGLGLDAVSAGEIYTGIKAGIDPKNIVFHGNNKTDDEVRYAIENKVSKLVVDSISEIIRTQEIAAEMDKKVDILVRINPSTEDSETHDKINTGQTDCKFGVPLVEVVDSIKLIKESKNLEYKGLHYHIGSMLFKTNSHIVALKKGVTIIKTVKEELGLETEVLNMGGGFGIDYLDPNDTVEFSSFIDEIMKEAEEGFKKEGLKRPEIFIEPGRWIAAEAGITLYEVGVVKEIPEVRTYVSIDGGMPDNPRPALYGAKYRAVVANKILEEPTKEVRIAGKCCETGDILIEDIKLPKMERGDYLAVFSTGAYNYSMSSNYNRIGRPAVVFLKDGKDELSIRRETYEDMLHLEV